MSSREGRRSKGPSVNTTGRLTKRGRLPEESVQNRDWYRLLVDRMNDGLAVQDENGLVTYVNGRLCELTGYSRDELVGRHVTELVDGCARELFEREMARRRQGEPGFYELVATRKDGNKVFLIVSAEPLYDAHGHYTGSFGVITDITERKRAEDALLKAKIELESRVMERTRALENANQQLLDEITERRRAEEALRDSEERFRVVVETASEAIISADSQGNIVFWNKAAQTTFGHSAAEAFGKPLTLIIPERFQEEHRRGLRRLASTGRPNMIGKTVEMAGLRKDGSEFPLELSLANWRTRKGVFYTAIIRDITERKRAEEALQEAREDLEARVERRMQRGQVYGLSFRELTVLHLVAQGKSDKEIALALGISPRTVQTHLASILNKMGAASRTEASVRAVREGLLE